jgi:glucose-6-phosphate dehydrogenase assembly protein OpcA
VTAPAGIPVPIGAIEKELGRLWEASGEGKTRASLINLAIYSQERDSLARNSEVIRGIAGEHAMRALLIEANPSAPQSNAEAWITMNCYVRGNKGGEVCSEQISFRLEGEAARALQSVVFSHLDSDLPLVLWWQSDFPPPTDGRLWRWVDRLIFDSRQWEDPRGQFGIISGISSITESRIVLCDLNWARSLPVRQSLAGIFDTPCILPQLSSIRTLHLDHAPGHRTTALLLVGWLADRLDWVLKEAGTAFLFRDSSGKTLKVTFGEAEGASISRMILESEHCRFQILREPGSDVYVTTAEGGEIAPASRMVRARREETSETLLAELSRGGRHPLYLRAIGIAQSMIDPVP